MNIKFPRLIILFIVMCIFLCSSTLFASQEDDLRRKRVGIIPNKYDSKYNIILEEVFGKDSRFIFIDPRLIPETLREWEKRQTGITERDDTSELYVNRADYLVSFEDIEWKGPEKITKVYYKREGKIVKVSHRVTTWESEVKGTLRVVDLMNDGRITKRSIEASGSGSSYDNSYNSALSNIQRRLAIQLKRLFPIEAAVFDVTSSKMRLMMGKEGGVKKGQRFIVKEIKQGRRGKKSTKVSDNMAFVQICKVDDEISRADIIYASADFSAKKAVAVEKYYAGVSYEFYYAAVYYDMKRLNGERVYEHSNLYGFKILAGNEFQFGWGMNFGTVDRPDSERGFLKISLSDFTFRYNTHLHRRLFTFFEVTGSYEYADTMENYRDASGVEDPDNAVPLDSWTLSGTIGAGFKFIINKHLYLYGSAAYTLASAFDDWEFDKDDPSNAGSTNNYDQYIEEFSPGGFKATVGLGLYF